MKETHEHAVKRGKKSKAAGSAFELRVRKDLESIGWTVDKWSNNVEFQEIQAGSISDVIFECDVCGRFELLFEHNGEEIFCNGFSISSDIDKMIIDMLRRHDKKCTGIVKKICEGQECSKITRGKLIPAKPHMVFNPKIKRFIPLQRSSGFPDFIAFKQVYKTNVIDIGIVYDVIGVESKMDGKLDKLEKEKCKWLLENKIFSKILIAEKTKVKNKIVVVHHDFKKKYRNFLQ